jgi:hypothetical protein
LEQNDAIDRAYTIPDEVSDINLDKFPHIVCFLDYKRALESKYGTVKGTFMMAMLSSPSVKEREIDPALS